MKAIPKAVALIIVGVFAIFAALFPVAGQGSSGTVSVQVVYCPQLAMAAELPGVPDQWCGPGPAQFSFYLVGDGTADFELLDVPLTGTASIELPVGEYEVYEENTLVKMSVLIEAGQTTSIIFGIPSEAAPETPVGEFNISTWECPGVTEVAITDSVAVDCVRIATNLSFYPVGDGTNDYYGVPTFTNGPILTGLLIGDYEVVDEPTQAHMFLTVSEGMSDVHIVYPRAADPDAPTPVPTSAAQPVAPKPTAAAVTSLPSTGSGATSDMVALGIMTIGVVFAAGAIGLGLRKY